MIFIKSPTIFNYKGVYNHERLFILCAFSVIGFKGVPLQKQTTRFTQWAKMHYRLLEHIDRMTYNEQSQSSLDYWKKRKHKNI